MAEVLMWGTRGSMPGGSAEMEAYGSNTSCVSVTLGEDIIIFDAGTGIVRLGRKLVEHGHKRPVHIFLSHLHLDHVTGLGCFAPLFSEGIEVHLYSMGPRGDTGERKIKALLEPPYWPKEVRLALERVLWHELRGGETVLPFKGAELLTAPGIHEDPCLMYRLKAGEKKIAYLLDCEAGPLPSGRLKEFIRGCDLVIADGMYTQEEYHSRKGWGHSTWQQWVELGEACGVERVLISHHSPERTDAQLLRIQRQIDTMDQGRYSGRYFLAFEGERMKL